MYTIRLYMAHLNQQKNLKSKYNWRSYDILKFFQKICNIMVLNSLNKILENFDGYHNWF